MNRSFKSGQERTTQIKVIKDAQMVSVEHFNAVVQEYIHFKKLYEEAMLNNIKTIDKFTEMMKRYEEADQKEKSIMKELEHLNKETIDKIKIENQESLQKDNERLHELETKLETLKTEKKKAPAVFDRLFADATKRQGGLKK